MHAMQFVTRVDHILTLQFTLSKSLFPLPLHAALRGKR